MAGKALGKAGDKAGDNLRWRLVGDESDQGALFNGDDVVEHHVGTGEFRGMEFLHVNARTIINEVPAASRMPFRYTINVYRGCSHACVYCLAGETPVLMGDGPGTPIKDVRVGDVVYGTVRDGSCRRYVKTEVLAHWSTTKPAYRVMLEDGTRLVASGDHRFLTDRGWKHVTGSEHGPPRPHLTLETKLIGTGAFSEAPKHAVDYRQAIRWKRGIEGSAIESDAGLSVVSIESLGVELPMYDITTGTGDFIANGMLSHNCFARPTHEYLGLNAGQDFERRIVVKVNAVERLRAEVAARRWGGHHIAMGTNTDPYQRCEGKYHLTQGVIKVLSEAANPFSILTKSTLILRDLGLLAAAAERTSVRANLSVGTLDEGVWRLTEPATPHPRRRVDAVRRLNEAGVPCGVLIGPVIPGLSDRPDQLKEVVDACAEAGAVTISVVGLHLRPGVREHYLGWLMSARPDLMACYRERYGSRSYLPKGDQQALSAMVRDLVAQARARHPSPRQVRMVTGMDMGDPAVRDAAVRDAAVRDAAVAAEETRSTPADQLDFGL
jgi:DNA repair photolyase